MKSLLIITILLQVTFAFGQQKIMLKENSSREMLFKMNPTIIVIDSMITTPTALILSDSAIKQRIVQTGKDSIVIRVELNDENLKLVRLHELLKNFNVPSEFLELRVCINKIIIKDRSKILADVSQVKGVSIINDPYTADPADHSSDEKFLNIILLY
jgi:hypothetical protein